MTNETLNTIRSRRSCRSYLPTQITEEELSAVLEAGTYAASAMGRQSARILVVQDPADRALLTRMNAAVMGTDSDPMYGAPHHPGGAGRCQRPQCRAGWQPGNGQPDAGRRLPWAGQLLDQPCP